MSEWFNAVSATEAIFTARNMYVRKCDVCPSLCHAPNIVTPNASEVPENPIWNSPSCLVMLSTSSLLYYIHERPPNVQVPVSILTIDNRHREV